MNRTPSLFDDIDRVLDSIASNDNRAKIEHGQKRAKSMADRFREEKDLGRIVDFKEKKRFGREGYEAKQFYAPFEIEFDDGKKWEIFPTTVFRDRYKQSEWDAWNIKDIEPNVEYCIMVLSDDPDKAKVEDEKRTNHKVFAGLDRVLSEEDFYSLLEEKTQNARGLTEGQVGDERGRNFERNLCNCLKNPDNIKRWKGDSSYVGRDFALFEFILTELEIKPEDVERIAATDDIPRLPTGGPPKTDVCATIHLVDGSEKVVTISSKRTSKDAVSVHQYKAEDFIRVLGITDPKLEEAIRLLQKAGGPRNLKKERGGSDAFEYLSEKLPAYNKKLTLWVLGGVGGAGEGIQIADYVLARSEKDDSVEYAFYTVEDYAEKLGEVSDQFGTPFKWTFASGRKGKDIQLKTPIIL